MQIPTTPSVGNSKPGWYPTAQNKLMEEGVSMTVRHTFIHMDFFPSQSLRRCSSDPTVCHSLQSIEPLPRRQESEPNPARRGIQECLNASGGIGDTILEKLSEGLQDCDPFESEESQHQDEQKCLSIGSVGHHEGKCRACAYFYKKKCVNGYKCLYCHFPHEISKRPGKNTRRRNRVRNSREQDRIAEIGETWSACERERNSRTDPLTIAERWSDVV